MKVVLLGATGMVGQGALRECLLDDAVESVLCVGRAATGKAHPKLRELVHANLTDFSAVEEQLTGWDACFFCLGVSSAGMKEADYRRVTYDLTLAVARTLARLNPQMTFIYVSGAGTDSTEKGRSMWARVKGETENAVLALPFKAAYMFRPAMIRPTHGAVSKTPLYRAVYIAFWPLLFLLQVLVPKFVTTSDRVGRAMLKVARAGFAHKLVENADINALGVTS
jgi:uncharacterized protein YbjT (DUF2867 family)